MALPGRKRLAGTAVVTVLAAAVFKGLPDAPELWARLHGTTGARMIFGEDASGLSVLRLEPGGAAGRTTVFVNGVGQSTIPYGDIHTGLGMVPAFVHPAPRDVAIIGLGSGDTVYGVAGRQEIERITCIEIIAPQIDGLRRLGVRQPYGGLTGLLEDARIRHVAGDGRIFLMRSPRSSTSSKPTRCGPRAPTQEISTPRNISCWCATGCGRAALRRPGCRPTASTTRSSRYSPTSSALPAFSSGATTRLCSIAT